MAKFQIIKFPALTTSYTATAPDRRVVKKIEQSLGKYPLHIIVDGGTASGMFVCDSSHITKTSTDYKITCGTHYVVIRLADGCVKYANS